MKMKNLFGAFLAPFLLWSCSGSEDVTPGTSSEVFTYTVNATVEQPETRVTYTDTNATGAGTLNCAWEVGDVVTVSNGSQSYDFKVATVTNGGAKATLTYSGVQIVNSASFSGTAIYKASGEVKQTADKSTAHLKYGDNIKATLTNFNFTSGGTMSFKHVQKAVYRVSLKAPEALAAGSTMSIAGPTWANSDKPTVTIGWSVAKDANIVLYLIGGSGTLTAANTLKFVLNSTTGNSFLWSYVTLSTVTYTEEKFYLANLGTEYHTFVDLGLPSGTKWAAYNVGVDEATTSSDATKAYGHYIMWGSTSDNSNYTCSSSAYEGSLYNVDRATLVTQNKVTSGTGTYDYILKPDYDAARAFWGSDWRMPTATETQELYDNCTIKGDRAGAWKTDYSYHGASVKGYEMVSKINGNKIFLPAAGYRDSGSTRGQGSYGGYWSSSCYSGASNACYMNFNSSSFNPQYNNCRYYGYTVRPVLSSAGI